MTPNHRPVGVAVWGTCSETAFLDLTRPVTLATGWPTILRMSPIAERDTTARVDSRRLVNAIPRFPERGTPRTTVLSAEQRLAIAHAASSSGETQRSIGRRFGVAQSTVARISAAHR